MNPMPWQYISELEHLKSLIFKDGHVKQDCRDLRLAAERIAVWKCRGRVPIGIESTRILIKAKLDGSKRSTSSWSRLMVSATAISRFVTTLCDATEVNEADSNMYQAATGINLPAKFVELRHEIVHGQLPSLKRLEQGIDSGLEWIYVYYWSSLVMSYHAKDIANFGEDEAAAEISEELRNFQISQRNQIKSRLPADPKNIRQKAIDIAKLTSSEALRVHLVSSLLWQERMMIPGGKQAKVKLRESDLDMAGAFMLWDLFLHEFSQIEIRFPRILVNDLWLKCENQWTHSGSNMDHRTALSWLIHLREEKFWRALIHESIPEFDDIANQIGS